MTKKNVAFGLLASAFIPLAGQAQTDSTNISRNYALDEVVVTGTRNETDIRHLPMTVSIVNRVQIEQTHEPSLLPILTEQIPGLFTTSRGVMGFGVSDGAAGGISLRGMSGGSGRLMVLIDGHPQYMGLFGHPISDAYQTMMAERVEVLRGPASVLYGSNAMGGVVNIVTRKMKEDGVKKGKFSSTLTASYNRTDGHRVDLGFEQYGGYAKLGYDFSDNWKLWGDVNITHFNASNPGTVSAPLVDAYQRITRGMTSYALENHYERTSGALSFFYNWGRHKVDDGYIPSQGETPLDYRFHSKDNMMGLSWYQSATLFTGNRLTVGFDWYRFGGEAWNQYISGAQSGQRSDIIDETQDEIAGYIDFRQDIGSWLTFDAGVRADHHSHVGTEWIPQVGLSFHLPKEAEIKLSASKGFRYPLIREMFMWGVANPDLDAERMWNYELSYSQKLLDGRLSYGVNVFYIDAENLITVGMIDGRRMNLNTGEAKNAGVEGQIAYRFNEAWSADANYSYLHMDTPIIASPEHKLYVGAVYAKGRWHLSSGIQYIGGLYTEVGEKPKTEDFVLWNVRGSYRLTDWLSLWVKGENLLAQRYEINAGFPMPKATFMGGVNLKF